MTSRPSQPAPPGPVTDSPLFWLLVFSSMGLVALAGVGPKYAQRQARLERMYQARQEAAARSGGDVPAQEDQEWSELGPDEQSLGTSNLRPVMFLMAGLLLLAAVALAVSRAPRGNAAGPSLPEEPR